MLTWQIVAWTLKLTCRCYNLIQFSVPPFPVRFAYVAVGDYVNIFYNLALFACPPSEEETLRVRILKRFTRFVGSLSAELICLPLKCVTLCSGNYGVGSRESDMQIFSTRTVTFFFNVFIGNFRCNFVIRFRWDYI